MTHHIDRRQFITRAGSTLAMATLPMTSAQALCANSPNTLVVLFLRGGADGINLVVPRGDEANYLARRQTDQGDIALPPGGAELELDGFFELHPSLGPFKPLYDTGDLAVVHAMGGANDYSHFTAQDSIERVVPGADSQLVPDGWLARTLDAMSAQGALCAPNPVLNGVSIDTFMSKSLAAPISPFSVAFPDVANVNYSGDFAATRRTALLDIFNQANGLAHTRGRAAFETVSSLAGLADQPTDAEYPGGNGGLNGELQDAARLIKNPALGVRVITLNFGGWDHHSNLNNNLRDRAQTLSAAVSAFWEDLGAARGRTCMLIMTEFGRTANVNGNGGTDHGWGNAMFVLGGGIGGGRVLTRADAQAPGTGLATPSGHWPGLALDELHARRNGSPRDLKSTTDFRDVFGEVLDRFMGLPPAVISNEVLRGYTPQYPGLFL